MPYAQTNGIKLSYQRSGHGESVLLIMGSGAAGHVWSLHQTPAIESAGYETITFDNRGIPPSDVPAGMYSIDDMVADTAGLIETLDLAPCRIVGTSLGAMIAQELALRSPHLVRCAVLLATRARMDVVRRAQSTAELALREAGIRLPPAYDAVSTVLQMLSPSTLNNDAVVAPLLEIFEPTAETARKAHGQTTAAMGEDRREALGDVSVPCRVITFADDLVAPPHLGAEVAEAIPNCDLVEIPACGHLGYLERPAEVNSAIIEFLDKN